MSTQKRDCNTSEAIVIRKPVVVTIAIAKNFIDANHSREEASPGSGN